MSKAQRNNMETNCIKCGATTNKGKRYCSIHHPHPFKGTKPHKDKYAGGES